LKEEMERLLKLKAEIIEERKQLKEEKERAEKAPTGIIDTVSITITQNAIKLYTVDGRLINSITWDDLDEMKRTTAPDSYNVTEASAGPQALFRETFQNFIEFCNHIYLPPEVENITPDLANNPNIDPNTRAFLDMVIHYQDHFEKNNQWKPAFVRFFKWMCFLFKEDKLIRERVGWLFWWFIVKHGNKMILWEPAFDPRHWSPVTDENILEMVSGPIITPPLTEEQKMEVVRINEERMTSEFKK
jgi:hypothetical protein